MKCFPVRRVMRRCRTGHLVYLSTIGRASMAVEVREAVLMATAAAVMAGAVGREEVVVVV